MRRRSAHEDTLARIATMAAGASDIAFVFEVGARPPQVASERTRAAPRLR